MSDEIPMNTAARQGDPLSDKLSTVVMEEINKEENISEWINVDGESQQT